jgi:hypothetical protein
MACVHALPIEAWNGTATEEENMVNIKSLASSLNEGMDAWDLDNEDTRLET